MNKIIIFLILFVALITAKTFKYHDYNRIIKEIHDLQTKFPHYVQVFNAKDENITLPDLEQCGENECDFIYFVLTDFTQEKEIINNLPQILLIGGIHGDEIIGSNTILYLAKHILENHQYNNTLSYYLKNRYMILYPISNPTGFFQKTREERQIDISYDPNRDFAYNVKDDRCMLTATGIVISHIYNKYLIQAAISFHGGDNSITYPWGGYNHIISTFPYVGNKCPDHNAFYEIAQVLVKEADSNPKMNVDKYLTGTMTDIVYPVDGGLEDWAYGAGWENQYTLDNTVIVNCKQFNNENITMNTNKSHIKSLLFLVECAEDKIPEESLLGNDTFDKKDQWGHITRNIALSLSYIDLIKPYINIIEVKVENFTIEIDYKVQGCIDVSETYLLYRNHSINTNLPFNIQTNKTEGPGFWQSKNHIFNEKISLFANQSFDVSIVANCDKKWGISMENSIPEVGPQSHLALARTKDFYYAKKQ